MRNILETEFDSVASFADKRKKDEPALKPLPSTFDTLLDKARHALAMRMMPVVLDPLSEWVLAFPQAAAEKINSTIDHRLFLAKNKYTLVSMNGIIPYSLRFARSEFVKKITAKVGKENAHNKTMSFKWKYSVTNRAPETTKRVIGFTIVIDRVTIIATIVGFEAKLTVLAGNNLQLSDWIELQLEAQNSPVRKDLVYLGLRFADLVPVIEKDQITEGSLYAKADELYLKVRGTREEKQIEYQYQIVEKK